jgi:multiple sugar transport system permease protein
MPVLGVTGILVVLWLFRDFSMIYVLTQGGPVKATQTLSIMTYQEAFAFFRMGYASSIGVVTLVLCTIAGLLMVRRHAGSMY